MRLHLPKVLLAAVLAWPAGAFTSTTTNYPTGSSTPTTFNGDIWTWNNNGDKVSSINATYTKYSDTDVTYTGNAGNTGGPTFFYNYFFDSAETTNLGNTLRFSGATEDKALTTDYKFYVWIGGIITESGDYTYTLGRNTDATNFKLTGTNDVNMLINSDFKFLVSPNSGKTLFGSISIEKGGTWNIAKGKTLSFAADECTISLASGQTVYVTASGNGTENATLDLTGTISNSGSLNIGSGVELVLNGNYSGKTIVNNGTVSGTMNITSMTGFDTVTASRMDVSGTVTTSGNGFSQKTATIFSGSGSLADSAVVQYNGTDITSSLQNGTYSYWDKSTYYITGTNNTLNIQDLLRFDGVTSSIAIQNNATDKNTTFVSSSDAAIGTITSTQSLTFNVTDGTLTVGGHSNNSILITKTGSGTLKYTTASAIPSGDAILEIRGGNVELSTGGGTARIKGAIRVFGGAALTLSASDALGYDGGQTPSITLAGSAPVEGSELAKYAILDLGTTEQTMQTALNLNGYAKITGSEGGAFNSWSNNVNNFSKITVNGNHNEITCRVLVRQGLEVSVSENSSLEIRGTVRPDSNGQSAAGFKKTGLGLLTIMGDTSMDKQLQVQEGTMKISGATATNSLTGAVIVSDGATLTLAGTTTLNGTLSSVATGDDAAAALIAITGGTTTISGGGGGNGAFAGTIRVDQGAELSITSGHVNVLTGTKGKVVVNGTLSIGNKEGVNAAETFYNVSGSGLVTSAQTYTETTGDDGSTTSTGRLVTINLSTTDAFTGSVTATAGQVKLSGGRAENTLNTITANGGNVVIDSSMSARTISTSGTSAVSVMANATLTHDLMTYSGSTISGSNGSFSMFNGGTVTGGTVTQIGQDGSGYKTLNSQLSGVHFVSNAGTEARLNNSANSLTDLTVNGTVRLTQKASVTGNTTVGAGGKLYVESTDSSLGKVSGTGTIQTTVSQDIKLNTESGKEFTGTLEASGKNAVLSVSGVKELAALKADGGQVWANTVDASVTSVSISEVVLAGGKVGVHSGVRVEATVRTGSLTVSGSSTLLANLDLAQNGTLKLDSSLTMGSTLTLNSGITLRGSLLTGWTDRSQALTLFYGVDELILDGVTATADTSYDASSVFSGMSGYNLVMTGGTGGQDYIVQLVQSTPMPEPTTATLSLLALMGLAARRRRRKA